MSIALLAALDKVLGVGLTTYALDWLVHLSHACSQGQIKRHGQLENESGIQIVNQNPKNEEDIEKVNKIKENEEDSSNLNLNLNSWKSTCGNRKILEIIDSNEFLENWECEFRQCDRQKLLDVLEKGV